MAMIKFNILGVDSEPEKSSTRCSMATALSPPHAHISPAEYLTESVVSYDPALHQHRMDEANRYYALRSPIHAFRLDNLCVFFVVWREYSSYACVLLTYCVGNPNF